MLALLAAGALAYSNSFHGAFVFDDDIQLRALRGKPLWPPWEVGGPRPVNDWTLAVNQRINGDRPAGYHIVNLIIHLMAGLALFGLARRTLRMPLLQDRFADSADWLAFAIALLWLVHPLQTQSVTYIIQRAESLMGLLYLLTMYCAARGLTAQRRWPWFVGAAAAAIVGLGVKAVIVTAPLMVLIYDRCFVSGSFARSIKQSPGLYFGLLICWIIALPAMVLPLLKPGGVGESVGVGLPGLGPLDYLRTQFAVIPHYLRLSVWPHPLCIDYAWPVAESWAAVWLPGLLLVLIAAAALVEFLRRRPIGFLGAWFFVILSVTSSIVPVQDICVEHRMYLPLAAVIALVVCGAYRLGVVWIRDNVARRRLLIGALAVITILLGILTFLRNRDYRSQLALWKQTVQVRPQNARAWTNYGLGLFKAGRVDEAIEATRTGLALNPDNATAHASLGGYLAAAGRPEEAIQEYHKAIELRPDNSQACFNLANMYRIEGRLSEAVDLYTKVIALSPSHAEAYNNRGICFGMMERFGPAAEDFRSAIRINPNSAEAHNNLSLALERLEKVGTQY